MGVRVPDDRPEQGLLEVQVSEGPDREDRLEDEPLELAEEGFLARSLPEERLDRALVDGQLGSVEHLLEETGLSTEAEDLELDADLRPAESHDRREEQHASSGAQSGLLS